MDNKHDRPEHVADTRSNMKVQSATCSGKTLRYFKKNKTSLAPVFNTSGI